MNADQRQAVRDNARYLRQVRPIDPEEIYEYVEGQPHPATVRQVLREAAPGLGLVELADGTFVPVSDGPISVASDSTDALPAPVEGLPERHERAVADLLVDTLGPGWPDGESGATLRNRIREVKQQYLEGGDVTYDEITALGYAVYHLPATYAAARSLLGRLAAEGNLRRHCRVLDVGAGVGGQALALCDLLPDDALLEYHAVEPSTATPAVLEPLLADTGRNVHPTVHRERVEDHDPRGDFDLVLCANVLSELSAPAAVVADLLESLAADGTLVAIAPADRNTAVGLREVEREVESSTAATVYAPTCRLWPGETPTSTCWSFDRKPPLAVPAFQARLDEAGAGDGEFVNADVQFAFSELRSDGETRLDVRPSPDRYAKLAEMDAHVTERIDLLAVKLSHDLTAANPAATGGDAGDAAGSPGGEGDDANPLFLVGDGSEAVDHFAVLTERTDLNNALATADYGQALVFEGALALWNDDEAAYNLVVDGECVVDPVPW